MSFTDYHCFPVFAVMVLFLGAFLIVIAGHKKPVQHIVSLLATGCSLAFLLGMFRPVVLNGETIVYWLGSRVPSSGYAIGISMEVDALNLFFALLIAAAVFVSCVYSIQYMEHDDHVQQYYTLFLMLSAGVLGVVMTGDLFNMYIMVEIMTIAAVALTAFRSHTPGAVEAAFKYLVVGTIGSVCMLTGIMLLYARAHTLNLAQLSALIPGKNDTVVRMAFAFLFVGFSSKAFLVPFHPLAADAHGAAPASISVLISGVLTKSGIYAILRLMYFLYQNIDQSSMQFLMVALGSVSMFVCVTMALAQHDFKRLLAFHSISQIGYVLTAAGLCTAAGISAGVYHAMNHTFFKGLLFLAAGAVMHQAGTGDLNRLGGLSRRMPHTTCLFLIGAFSISGIPPFNGFASKWMIYQAIYQKAVESGNILFLFAVLVALITSVLTLASFVKVTKSVFFGELPVELANTQEAPFGMRLAMGMFAVICVLTGLFPELVTKYLTQPAAAAAFSASSYIDTAMGSGYAAAQLGENLLSLPVSFASAGVWSPVSWLLLMCVALLAVTLVAVAGKYESVSEKPQTGLTSVASAKYDVFFGGEKAEYSQGGGDDMFWGLKYNWRHYFSFMHELHSGIVNDYSLWAVTALGLAILFAVVVM